MHTLGYAGCQGSPVRALGAKAEYCTMQYVPPSALRVAHALFHKESWGGLRFHGKMGS